ncbi:nitrous oxide reductase accessory protein NosL [Macrococcus caseolyticus]|uniref:nitrous oxide reductase accessory protein NosL n=1 Tax=Macrococcoides caseolyticum TaxID=69966 RepID=UPI0024BCB2F6|nr:nitrous oxide reductase accessory protein NosL [Macrococcus caseolyticus]MDJ1110185.1 nitrous oxide reductase accessory protein NosL [Macrococcus caseolyticus]
MRYIITLLITAILLAGCGKPDLSPRDINQKTDKCVVCNMMIDHPEQAAQMVYNNEDHLIFDDIGCMMEHYNKENKDDIGMMYVKDYKKDKWIDATKAFYIYNKDIWTPMNYGVAAFETEANRDTFMKKYKNSKQLQFNDLKSFKWGIHA